MTGFNSKFTVKKKYIRIKVNYIFEECFLSQSSFVKNGTFCKISVMSALKLVFPTKHFPNLGKTNLSRIIFHLLGKL